MPFSHILLALFTLINFTSFLLMFQDKRKSMQGGNVDRTPEGTLFFLAAAFGAIGVYAGMFVFRHKTRKWYFQVGIPFLILQNLATLYLLQELFR